MNVGVIGGFDGQAVPSAENYRLFKSVALEEALKYFRFNERVISSFTMTSTEAGNR